MLKRLALVAAVLGALGIAATIVLWSIPAEDFILAPGSAKPLEDRVDVEGARPVHDGAVYYTDVSVRRTTLLERLLPFVRPDGSTVLPEHALLPPGTSESARDRQVAEEMDRSKDIASLVALRALGYEVEATATGVLVTGVFADTPASGLLREGDLVVAVDRQRVRTLQELRSVVGRREPGERVDLTVRRADNRQRITVGTIPNPNEPRRPFMGIQVDQAADVELPLDVDIDLGRVGGPSAGLPFALEIVRQLGRDVTGGCVIAATGALAFDGRVVSVGGLPQKTIAARGAGVDAFLVPAGRNAADARNHAEGLRIIPVETFQQALRARATAGVKC
jgi:PDZ domain-containing protein